MNRNIVGIIGPEQWLIVFTDDHYGSAIRKLGEWAANPELSFNWQDAARVCLQMSETQRVAASVGGVSPERKAWERQ